ncbi:glycoside hydrolase family 32 protein [Arthrobacter sp. C9C5]|uniref:glycoside hydrolase family 32 protein n=1 Tax=Arthrobacter sp. C9C5 TaxID=2735267 RepID=UPI0015845A32|nr:glycoside hydrolase family 32 protein [Arthrobacter sp. C9C5]NUU30603.1 glycoside hydrolase family 32 protein [Arthrobacter sp. C9C5]
MDTVARHSDPAFPRFHPRPAQGWMGGPAGLRYLDGWYHVFFDYNPDPAEHRRTCWGHLSSLDLLRWEEHPVALRPRLPGPDVWQQDGQPAAPVPPDPHVTAVRDPFLFTFQGRRFALQGAGLASGHAAVLLYRADELRDWRYEGIWFTTEDALAASHLPAGIWGCPQLVRVPDSSGAETWLLMASLRAASDVHHHPGGVGYLLGSLAEDTATGLPVFTPARGGKADLGPDFYAPQILSLPDRALLWGWSDEVSGLDGRAGRGQAATDAAGWAGLLTFPRQLAVHGDALAVDPAPELRGYRGRQRVRGAAGTLHLPGHAEAVVTGGEGRIRLVLASAAQVRAVFADTVAGGDELRIFVDGSIVEVYRHGSVPATVRAYPAPGEEWRLELPHGAAADVWDLEQPGTAQRDGGS